MHRESLIMHDEKISCLVKNLHIARGLHTSLKFIHREKNLCLAGIHASRNHASRVNNYARREDFMPRQNLCIARRLHDLLEFIHREKISCLAESYASREDSYLAGIYVSREDIHAPQEDIHG